MIKIQDEIIGLVQPVLIKFELITFLSCQLVTGCLRKNFVVNKPMGDEGIMSLSTI